MSDKTRLLSLLLAALCTLGGGACRRPEGEPRKAATSDPLLAPEPGSPVSERSASLLPSRHNATPPLPGQPASRSGSQPAQATRRPGPGEPAAPRRAAPEDRLSTDPRDQRPERPADDGGQVGHLRLDLPPPPPLALASTGEEPTRALRYELREGDLLVWEAEVTQRTELRNERSCPLPDAPATAATPPQQTIALSYRVQVTSRVTSAPAGRLTLETAFRKVRLTLPPGLSEQSELLSSLVASASYVQTLTRTGRTESFLLGKLTGAGMKSLLNRLRSPFGMVQPVLPEPAVGAGAAWSHEHRLVLHQPGGRVAAHYVTRYGLTRFQTGGPSSSAHLKISNTVSLQGQVMGEDYRGQGQGQGLLELDAARGILRAAAGEMSICTSVMGRSSRTHTRYSQRLLDAESKLGNATPSLGAHPAPPRPAPAAGSPPPGNPPEPAPRAE